MEDLHADDCGAREVRELGAVRVLLEGQAAHDAALYATDPAALRELRRLSTDRTPGAGRRFHAGLAQAAGNTALAQALDDVLGRLAAVAGEDAVCGDSAAACAEHIALLDAVLGGRAQRALNLAQVHGRHARQHSMATLSEQFFGRHAIAG